MTSRPRATSRPLWYRLARTALLVLSGTYLLLIVALYLLQDRLIFPGSATQGIPGSDIRADEGAEVVHFKTRDGLPVAAFFGRALDDRGRPVDDPRSRPTLLFFLGNGQCTAHSSAQATAIRDLGMNVFIPDFLGFGQSGGRASEANCYATADAAYDHLVARPDVDPSKLLIGGFSLGGAVAIDLASRRPSAGLIASCTFTTMADMARDSYPFVPTRFLLRHEFRSIDKIARVRVPILLGHGEIDPLISSDMTDSLARAAGGNVTRIDLAGTGHDDLLRVATGDDRDKIRAFLRAIEQGTSAR